MVLFLEFNERLPFYLAVSTKRWSLLEESNFLMSGGPSPAPAFFQILDSWLARWIFWWHIITIVLVKKSSLPNYVYSWLYIFWCYCGSRIIFCTKGKTLVSYLSFQRFPVRTYFQSNIYHLNHHIWLKRYEKRELTKGRW